MGRRAKVVAMLSRRRLRRAVRPLTRPGPVVQYLRVESRARVAELVDARGLGPRGFFETVGVRVPPLAPARPELEKARVQRAKHTACVRLFSLGELNKR